MDKFEEKEMMKKTVCKKELVRLANKQHFQAH